MNHSLYLFTDGACSPNPGNGGAGYYITRNPDTCKHNNPVAVGGFCPGIETTNNIMEMTAALKGLRHCIRFMNKQRYADSEKKVVVVADSKLLVNGMNDWVDNWAFKGWITGNGTPVKNQEYWEQLVLIRVHFTSLRWEWTRGHTGVNDFLSRGNEQADHMAVLVRESGWQDHDPYRWKHCALEDYKSVLELPEIYRDLKQLSPCPRCHQSPRFWMFDNGCYIRCLCITNKHAASPVRVESPLSFYKRKVTFEGYAQHRAQECSTRWEAWCQTGEFQYLPEGQW